MSLLPSVHLLALQQAVQDTAAFHRFREGVPPAPPPIPGAVATVLRSIFNAPLWMWVVGLLIGVTAGVLLARLLWKSRGDIRAWLTTRSRIGKLALAGSLVLVLAVAAWGGTTSWNYMEHENEFCMGCHIMEGPWNKFALEAGKHGELTCHDCHKQSLYASTRQLVLWVANRPEKIPPHAGVPNGRCEACHAVDEAEKWTRIKETSGHRTHLESDSTALAEVQCITCHGADVHTFIPAKETCGQSGCHEQLEMRLGKMAAQTSLHCNQCHQFTEEVPRLATRDSAAGTMRPGERQCLGCHEMQRILADFDPAKEPHSAVCGTCHNPHTQETPQAAGKTCTDAQCHGNWRETVFHVGAAHRRVGEQCLTCHVPHASRLDASDCVACHNRITARPGSRLRPPLPFDTARALRPPELQDSRQDDPARGEAEVSPSDSPPPLRLAAPPMGGSGSSAPALNGGAACGSCHAAFPSDTAPAPGPLVRQDSRLEAPVRGEEVVRTADLPPAFRPAVNPPAQPDSFPHARHTRLACITCHASGTQHGRLTFQPPRGCQICHHQGPRQSNCAACHAAAARAEPVPLTVAIAVRDSAERSRPVSFAHSVHSDLGCIQCHTEPVSLAPPPAVRACRDCHADHHAAGRTCATCHTGEQLRSAHAKDVSASHRACDACHTASTVALLTPDRSFCLTCHKPQADHYVRGQCTTCHFLKPPAEFRPHLLGRQRK
jgi:hypothetical protein